MIRLYFSLCIFIFLTSCASNVQPFSSEASPVGDKKSGNVEDREDRKNTILQTQEQENIMTDEIGSIEENTSEQNCIVFDDFSEASDYAWGIVNDGVMGGRSQGSFEILENTLRFSGTINTNGGGFSSLRANLEPGILSDYNFVTLTAKSDGREYKVTFRDANNSRISHQAIIPFQTPGEFETVSVSYNQLETTFFGQNIQAQTFQKEKAQQIGVIIADGIDGAFQLDIDEVRFCR